MYFDAPGEAIGLAELHVAKARAFADYLVSEKHKFARFIEASKELATGSETVVCDLFVEVSQDRANDIRDTERLAVTFDANDEQAPEVVALRDDFPPVPHLNQRPAEFPRSLCLYAVPYTTTRLRWTPTMFVERIRQWLEQTASGTLHQEDQPLEPVFLGHFPPLIVPSNFLQTISDAQAAGGQAHFSVYATGPAPGTITGFVAVDPNSPNATRTCDHVATAIIAPPQTHGVVQKTPTSLDDVLQVAQAVGVDLLTHLRRCVTDLTAPVVDAFYAEEIGVEHALLLAKLQADQQEKAIAECFQEAWAGAGKKPKRIPLPVRHLQHWIEHQLMLILKLAPFSRKDAQLVLAAGAASIAPSEQGTTSSCLLTCSRTRAPTRPATPQKSRRMYRHHSQANRSSCKSAQASTSSAITTYSMVPFSQRPQMSQWMNRATSRSGL
jgi:hypothetical protein